MGNTCSIYKAEFDDYEALLRHHGPYTQKGIGHKCSKCDNVFCNAELLKNHTCSKCPPGNIECIPCKRFFVSKDSLAQHEAAGRQPLKV
jgi:hypothetical protein